MKFFTPKKLFQYFLPTTFTLFMLVTVERTIHGDIGIYERLYGLPFPFISSNYAFTGHLDVYIIPLLLDLTIYFTATLLVFQTISKLGIKLKTHWTFVASGVVICIFWLCTFALKTFESSFKVANDFDYETKQSRIYFGSFPWQDIKHTTSAFVKAWLTSRTSATLIPFNICSSRHSALKHL